MEINKTGMFISELRKKKGYTQKELAEKLMVTDKAISRWETGKGLPDTSILKALSETLEVSVSELLSGEYVEEKEMQEKTDNIILDSLSYSKKRILSIISAISLIIGIILMLSPLYLATKAISLYSVLGALLFIFSLAFIVLKKRKVKIRITNRGVYFTAIISLIAALILEILPYGVILNFAPGPNETIRKTFSYFSLIPFGYANFTPLFAGCMTTVIIALCVIALFCKQDLSKFRNAAFICSVITFLLSFVPMLLFGSDYMSSVSYIVSALIMMSVCLQAVANRKWHNSAN